MFQISTSALAAGLLASRLEAHTCPHGLRNCSPPPPKWDENETSIGYKNLLEPPLKKVQAGRTVSSLTPAEWRTVSVTTRGLAEAWAELANLHHADAYVIANQSALKQQFDPRGVDLIVQNGSHYGLAQFAQAATVSANKLEDPCGCKNNQPISMRCGVNFAFWDVGFAMMALLFPPAALIFGGAGIAVAIAGAFICD
jgi:hypothetical protein